MNKNFLTVHIINELPFHNVNRDEVGRPKQVFEGGVERARISSQALKRAARIGFEKSRTQGLSSFRSRLLGLQIAEDAAAANLNRERDAITDDELQPYLENAAVSVFSFTTGKKKLKPKELSALLLAERRKRDSIDNSDENQGSKSDDDKLALVWLSEGEISKITDAVKSGQSILPSEVIPGTHKVKGAAREGTTDDLSIAMFGRMFANCPELQNEAAVAVSHAVTTHEASVETEFFTAGDDLQPHGAAHMGTQAFTTGVYYRTFTIDRAQLNRTWSRRGRESAAAELAEALKQLVVAVPTGKRTSTAPFVLPKLIVAEEQSHRVNQSFNKPVAPHDEEGGYLRPTSDRLVRDLATAREFAPSSFGKTYTSGTEVYADTAAAGKWATDLGGASQCDLDTLTHKIAAWALNND